ncbi:MAG: LamG-like jellyroll fold domain-containing protein, partial [Paludibacter sp.]|nr:LamG-like jellyroll fold domain-containing protein [Paludibacter sp.]
MKQTNFFRLLSIALIVMFFSANLLADAWSDRGYVQTTTSHKWFQILDPAGDPITKYITGSTFTFETWFYLDDMSKAKGMFFYINNGMQFGFSPNEARLLFQNSASGRTVDVWLDYTTLPEFSDLTAGKWIHIALVVDGNNWKVYMDGTERYNQNLAGGYLANTTNFLIGGDWWGNFQGKLAETRVWNSARTASEIADNRRKILPIATPTLIGRINFGEGSGESSQNFCSVGGNAWASAGGASVSWGLVSKTPSNLQPSSITSTGFNLTWDGGPETKYEVVLRTKGSTSDWTYIPDASKPYLAEGLTAGSAYDVKVKSTHPLETDYSAAVEVSLITSTIDVQESLGLVLTTNPSNWQIESKNTQAIRALVYNLSGSTVGEFSNQNKLIIDKSNFNNG